MSTEDQGTLIIKSELDTYIESIRHLNIDGTLLCLIDATAFIYYTNRTFNTVVNIPVIENSRLYIGRVLESASTMIIRRLIERLCESQGELTLPANLEWTEKYTDKDIMNHYDWFLSGCRTSDFFLLCAKFNSTESSDRKEASIKMTRENAENLLAGQEQFNVNRYQKHATETRSHFTSRTNSQLKLYEQVMDRIDGYNRKLEMKIICKNALLELREEYEGGKEEKDGVAMDESYQENAKPRSEVSTDAIKECLMNFKEAYHGPLCVLDRHAHMYYYSDDFEALIRVPKAMEQNVSFIGRLLDSPSTAVLLRKIKEMEERGLQDISIVSLHCGWIESFLRNVEASYEYDWYIKKYRKLYVLYGKSEVIPSESKRQELIKASQSFVLEEQAKNIEKYRNNRGSMASGTPMSGAGNSVENEELLRMVAEDIDHLNRRLLSSSRK